MEDARFVLHSNILILLANYAYLILALVTRSLRKMVDVILVMLVPDLMKLAEHARKILVISSHSTMMISVTVKLASCSQSQMRTTLLVIQMTAWITKS